MGWRRARHIQNDDRGTRHGSDEEASTDEAFAEDAWEYLVEDGELNSERLERRCNDLGAQGWELVAVLPLSRLAFSGGGRTTSSQLFFKRPLR